MLKNQSPETFINYGLEVIKTEASVIDSLAARMDNAFAQACEILCQCEGRVIVTGMGKSGHIGSKIAATMASTGTPAFFMHPGDAGHGDMGMVTKQDTVLALSNSGNTNEIVTLIPLIKRLGIPLIALSGDPKSPLALAATVNVDVSVEQEACPLDLAPTSSTTAALVMGDALAIALMNAKGFTSQDFALSHPSGSLGRRLLLTVSDIMHSGSKIPSVSGDTILGQALIEISQKGLGMTTIVDNNNILRGIFTDGDLRRVMDKGLDVHTTAIENVMTENCKTIFPDVLAVEALQIMENFKITSLVVADDNKKPVGIIHMHDILRAGVV